MKITKHIELTKKEVDIIAAALNNRMVFLQERMDEGEGEWAHKEWEKCLNLQCEWFNVEAEW